MSGWKEDNAQYKDMEQLFETIWEKLQKTANEDGDEEISEEEWCTMWDLLQQHIASDKAAAQKAGEEYSFEVPIWLDKYIEYKFSLLDRTRDGKVEIDEYAYVMEDFNVREKDAKTAFNRMTEDGKLTLDGEYFKKLSIQYFLSDDPEDPGTFVTGKLDFDDVEVRYTPTVEEKKAC